MTYKVSSGTLNICSLTLHDEKVLLFSWHFIAFKYHVILRQTVKFGILTPILNIFPIACCTEMAPLDVAATTLLYRLTS